MRIVNKEFDIDKWRSYSPQIIQEHIQNLLGESLHDPRKCYYRGGFGRGVDFKRLLNTGSDYEAMQVKVKGKYKAVIYASPFESVGREPWCRGLDPLYWALKGHQDTTGWNPINCLVAYSAKKMKSIPFSDLVMFSSDKPTTKCIEAIIMLKFNKDQGTQTFK